MIEDGGTTLPLGLSKGTLGLSNYNGEEKGSYFAPDGSGLNFTEGKLTSTHNRKNFKQIIGYDGEGNINRISDGFGRSVSIISHNGKFDSIADPEGHTIQYHYDTQDNLIEVDYPTGKKIYYQYKDSHHPRLLTAVLDSNKNVVSSWRYDSQSRVIDNIVSQ